MKSANTVAVETAIRVRGVKENNHENRPGR